MTIFNIENPVRKGLTIPEAAERLGVTVETVRTNIRKGVFEIYDTGIKSGKGTKKYIVESSLKNYKKRRLVRSDR